MKVLAATFAYNEGPKIIATLKKLPQKRDYDFYVMDDGSTDNSLCGIEDLYNVNILKNDSNCGIGYSIKRMLQMAMDKQYDIAVIMAGNGKDDPNEIPLLLFPITDGKADFVQGSRYLPGGKWGNMPFYRQIATRYLHPALMSLITGQNITDSTNGFRAIKLSILKDKRINIHQKWLEKYELEPYLLFKSIKCGHKTVEVAVSKIYPSKGLSYTKMKPLIGWWSILRPLIFLALGIKK